MEKIRTWTLEANSDADCFCHIDNGEMPREGREEVKVIELNPVLDLLENTLRAALPPKIAEKIEELLDEHERL